MLIRGSKIKFDKNGNIVVEYVYDAWGNFEICGEDEDLGNINPFRYRSYYYDTETGLYYLQTRYYDPETGRFLNMDSLDYADPDSINGLNLYAYCNNNPVMYVDPDGHLFFTILLIGLIAGTVFGASLNGVDAYNNGARGWDLVGAIFAGAVIGGAIGTATGIAAGLGALAISAGAAAIGTGLGGGFALVLGGTLSGGALVAVGAGSVVAGSLLVAGSVVGGLSALNVLFASSNRPNNNGAQNKQFKDAAREAGLDVNDPAVWDELNDVHRYIRKNKLNLGYKDLVKLIRDFFG